MECFLRQLRLKPLVHMPLQAAWGSFLEDAARLTLGHQMTFEFLGQQLRLFKGRALCDLVPYRKRGTQGS